MVRIQTSSLLSWINLLQHVWGRGYFAPQDLPGRYISSCDYQVINIKKSQEEKNRNLNTLDYNFTSDSLLRFSVSPRKPASLCLSASYLTSDFGQATFGSAINLTSFLRAMLTCLWYNSRSSSMEDLQEIKLLNTSTSTEQNTTLVRDSAVISTWLLKQPQNITLW